MIERPLYEQALKDTGLETMRQHSGLFYIQTIMKDAEDSQVRD